MTHMSNLIEVSLIIFSNIQRLSLGLSLDDEIT